MSCAKTVLPGFISTPVDGGMTGCSRQERDSNRCGPSSAVTRCQSADYKTINLHDRDSSGLPGSLRESSPRAADRSLRYGRPRRRQQPDGFYGTARVQSQRTCPLCRTKLHSSSSSSTSSPSARATVSSRGERASACCRSQLVTVLRETPKIRVSPRRLALS